MSETRKEENFDSRRLFSLFQEVPNKLKLGVLSFIHKIESDILFFTRQKPVCLAESDQTMYISLTLFIKKIIKVFLLTIWTWLVTLYSKLISAKESHHWHPGFIIATILLCLVFRFISVFLFGFLVNLSRMDKIELKEQFIMAYGGLRGAVGFSLAVVLSKDEWYRELFVSTALVMVFFTVFLQGENLKEILFK